MLRIPVSAAIVVSLLLATLVPTDAQAQTIEDGTIMVIQPKPVLRRHRLQLTPRVGMTMNSALYRQWAMGGSLSFNINEKIYVGGIFDWLDFNERIGGPNQAFDDTIDQTRAIPEVAPLNWVAGAEVGYVPLYGKLVLFNRAIGFFDLYVSGGPMAVHSQRGVHVGGHIGGGVNLYFSEWFGLNFDFRDRMTVEEVPTAGRRFTNTVTSSIGFTILMPFRANYRLNEGEQ